MLQINIEDIQPLGSKVIVLPDLKERITPSGIILPEEEGINYNNLAKVISVGDDVRVIKPNDYVIIPLYVGFRLDMNEREYVVFYEEDIEGVVEFGENSKILIKALGDNVFIKESPPEDKTPSGIIIPDFAKESSQKGIVVSVGAGLEGESTTLKKGDEIIYGKYSGNETQIGGETFVIMKESEVFLSFNENT